MPDFDAMKRRAGEAGALLVQNDMIVGLGTGSTAKYLLHALAARKRVEKLRFTGICTSRQTEQLASELGLPTVPLTKVGMIDLYLDGADEIDGSLRLIKGGGGALLREKVVATHSRYRVIMADRTKRVAMLGTTFKLPVDIAPFAAEVTCALVAERTGSAAAIRIQGDAYFRTDEGNFVVDCKFPNGIVDAEATHAELKRIVGVVETGLFIGLCHHAIIGDESGVEEFRLGTPIS